MRRLFSLTLAALVLGSTLMVASASPAGACSCGGISDESAFAQADAVFIGQVSRTHPAREGGDVRVAILTVSEVFKGDVDRQQAIVTPADSAACGLDFTGDLPWLVFTRAESAGDIDIEEGFFFAQACSGTRTVDAATDLAFAGTPYAPNDAGPPDIDDIRNQLGDPRSSLLPEAIIFAGVIAFVLGLAAWFSRQNRPATSGV